MASERRDLDSVIAWLEEWQALIRARDFQSARRLFRDDVLGFGTAVHAAYGLDDLVAAQWEVTWPRIEDFTFQADEGRIEIVADGTLALVATPWMSKGVRPSEETFDRGGRCTIVLARSSRGEPWAAVHTHFSLAP